LNENELIFHGLKPLFDHIHGRGGADAAVHGSVGLFYSLAKTYFDPNSCSCKKGKGAHSNLLKVCRSFPSIRGDQLTAARALFENRIVVVNEGGHGIVRF
jgi:hypothetical protein